MKDNEQKRIFSNNLNRYIRKAESNKKRLLKLLVQTHLHLICGAKVIRCREPERLEP